MSVSFLLGAGGSGKSTALRALVIKRSLKDPASRHIVIVPEQSTFTTQKAFIADHPRKAMLNIEVISFGHLARRVFREFSAEKAQILGENGKQMLLALAAEDCRKDLEVYARQIGRPGFLAKLGSLFAEWDMNDISPERLREIADGGGITPLLSAKLKDLAAIYSAFRTRLGSGTMTAEETLPRLLKLLPRSDAARGAYLYFDGFTGFTTVQYRIITELIRRSRGSLFVFTLPKAEALTGSHSSKEQLFGMSAAAIKSIERCAEDAGKLLEKTVFAEDIPSPAARPEDLDFLEKHLMRFDRETFAGAPEHMKVFACRNVRTECRAAVLEIVRLAREEGLQWREIALTVGDKDRYVPLLEEDLKEAGIPYFTDRRAPLGRHPLIRLTQAALDAVTGGFDRDSVLRYLKNECGPLSRKESDRFENYLLETGISGRPGRKALTQPYTRLPRLHHESDEAYEKRKAETLLLMNEYRERAMGPLLALRESIKGRTSAGEMAGAVLDFLEALGVKEKLSRRAALYEQEGRLREADEWKGVYDSVCSFFTEMKELLGSLVLPAADFRLLASSGLNSLKLGRLPAEPDQLVIGDVERSRYNDVKALLVLGMNDGVIPSGSRSGGIITDRERIQLEQFEPDLGYTDERALFEERFYIYRLLTRPAALLYLSFSQTGADGKEIGRSPVLREIEAMFPDLGVQDFAALCRKDPYYAVAGKETAARVLAEWFRLKQDGWEELYSLLAQSPEFRTQLARLEEGALAHYQPAALDPAQAEALYGTVLQGSVTRLESFAACPYRHFLEYGLLLRERSENRWEASDHGNFFHKVMEVILTSVRDRGLSLRALDEAGRDGLIREGILAAAAEEEDSGLGDKENGAYLLGRWSSFFDEQLKAMGEMEEAGGFRPERFEMRFGGRNALELDLGGGRIMRLSGRIDRLDSREENGQRWIRIVDYKTSDRYQVDVNEIRAGLQLQLFTYLDAALREEALAGRKAKPAGLYYAALTEKWLKEDSEDASLLREKLLAEYKLSGMTASEAEGVCGDADGIRVSADTLRAVCSYVKKREAELGRRILSGEIGIVPLKGRNDPCTYCAFRSVCRFDRRIPGMETAVIEKGKTPEVLQEMLDDAAGKEAEP